MKDRDGDTEVRAVVGGGVDRKRRDDAVVDGGKAQVGTRKRRSVSAAARKTPPCKTMSRAMNYKHLAKLCHASGGGEVSACVTCRIGSIGRKRNV